MNARSLKKDDINGFLESLRKMDCIVWAPVATGEAVEIQPLAQGGVPVLDYGNSRISPKAMAFPQSERMFVFGTDPSQEGSMVLREVPQETGDRVAFGIRPCDGRSFLVLDKVFLKQGAAADPYYQGRRNRTILMGLGCNSPCSTCFCHWTGGGPFSTDGLDILMTDLGEVYTLQPISPAGDSLLGKTDLPPASEAELMKAAALAREALTSMGDPCDVGRIRRRPLMDLFDSPYWDLAHETCIKCGTCTFLCPTCSCFDIQDEERRKSGLRGRNWDSCMFPLATVHASGHNPRPTGRERFRQRFMHKLKYFQDDFDMVMCVGCGRCIQYCPVNIDIREVIAALGA
jgi:sulfhydrogenase subunit beta (sulfur reductase)